MSANEMREYLHKYIDIADERFLSTIYEISLMNKQKIEKRVYYRTGKLISKQQLYNELKEAEAEIENRDFMTIEAFIKESEKWS